MNLSSSHITHTHTGQILTSVTNAAGRIHNIEMMCMIPYMFAGPMSWCERVRARERGREGGGEKERGREGQSGMGRGRGRETEGVCEKGREREGVCERGKLCV
jgi:hypothetical protein